LLGGQRPVAADNERKPGQQFWVTGDGFSEGALRWLAVTDCTNASHPIVIGPVSVGTYDTCRQ
jgi:hypothetical protein